MVRFTEKKIKILRMDNEKSEYCQKLFDDLSGELEIKKAYDSSDARLK